jgi:hypothetical protein
MSAAIRKSAEGFAEGQGKAIARLLNTNPMNVYNAMKRRRLGAEGSSSQWSLLCLFTICIHGVRSDCFCRAVITIIVNKGNYGATKHMVNMKVLSAGVPTANFSGILQSW